MPPPPQAGLNLCLEAKVPAWSCCWSKPHKISMRNVSLASVCALSILFLESYPWDLFPGLLLLPTTLSWVLCTTSSLPLQKQLEKGKQLHRCINEIARWGHLAYRGTFKITQQCAGLREHLPRGSCPHPHNVQVRPAGVYDLVLKSYQCLSMHICDKRKPALSWLLQILSSFESHSLAFSIRCIQPENNDQPLMKHAGFPSWLRGSHGA